MNVEKSSSDEFEKVFASNSRRYGRGKYAEKIYQLEKGECIKFVFDDISEFLRAAIAMCNFCRLRGNGEYKCTSRKASKTVYVMRKGE